MGKIISSKSRRQPRQVGDVNVHHGNAADMNGFKHFRAGHEIAKPVKTDDGSEVFETPTGKKFRITKMSS